MSSSGTARFLSSLFSPSPPQAARLLDANAGAGPFSWAFLDRFAGRDSGFQSVQIIAYEPDVALRERFNRVLSGFRSELPLRILLLDDFIAGAVRRMKEDHRNEALFSHAILNPPCGKIDESSPRPLLLREAGIEAIDACTVFVCLATQLMARSGQIVATIPRGLCVDPRRRHFRELVLRRAAIRHIHAFKPRNRASGEDGPLQEDVIISLVCGGVQGKVAVSTSTDGGFTDAVVQRRPFDSIVLPDDAERLFRLPA